MMARPLLSSIKRHKSAHVLLPLFVSIAFSANVQWISTIQRMTMDFDGIHSSVIRSFFENSILSCFRFCTRNEECKSAFYISVETKCITSTMNRTSINNLSSCNHSNCVTADVVNKPDPKVSEYFIKEGCP